MTTETWEAVVTIKVKAKDYDDARTKVLNKLKVGTEYTINCIESDEQVEQ